MVPSLQGALSLLGGPLAAGGPFAAREPLLSEDYRLLADKRAPTLQEIALSTRDPIIVAAREPPLRMAHSSLGTVGASNFITFFGLIPTDSYGFNLYL